MYLTYEEYLNMGGTLNETDFDEYEVEAEILIDYYTFNRLQNINFTTINAGIFSDKSEKIISGGVFEEDFSNDFDYTNINRRVKQCMYKLISIAQLQNKAFSVGQNIDVSGNSAITSQSNDGVSISYNVLSASEAFERCKTESVNIIKHYLNGIKDNLGRKLLYRGLYPNE